MRIVWLTWKDIKHPKAGGAELVQHEICKRLVKDGHKVVVITSRPQGLPEREYNDGYKIVRRGGQYTVYWHARRVFRRSYASWAQHVVEEVNTIPFFARYYVRQKHTMLFHQLARKVWFYQYFPPLNLVGYLLEPLYLRVARVKNVIAMSNSTKADLQNHGYKNSTISIISEGNALKAVEKLSAIRKTKHPSILSLGSVRPMKQTMHIVKAFEIAKTDVADLKLTLIGGTSGKYGKKTLDYIAKSKYAVDIDVLGYVDTVKIPGVIQKHHYLVSTAVKEGWGLTITEAASQGTPAIAYDVDGQRDAVNLGKAGMLIDPNTESLAAAIVKGFGEDANYSSLQKHAWQFAKTITFDQSYKDFLTVIDSE